MSNFIYYYSISFLLAIWIIQIEAQNEEMQVDLYCGDKNSYEGKAHLKIIFVHDRKKYLYLVIFYTEIFFKQLFCGVFS